jgi:signal transduction histidine kinase
MLMPASSEFVALCRLQLALLTQSLGASLSIVYLTQDMAEGLEAQLVPLVAYPEMTARPRQAALHLPETVKPSELKGLPGSRIDLQSDFQSFSESPIQSTGNQSVNWQQEKIVSENSVPALVAQRRMMLPLIHEDMVLGVLLTERNDRAWDEWEQSQIHQIAGSLALACVMDQRCQWLSHSQQQQGHLQAQQHEILDNLLHQFRNSLTAVQTFSKLILKRLLPGDSNLEIAASIVRETARLRDLSQQLEQATLGSDPTASPSPLLPAAVQEATTPQTPPVEGENLVALPPLGVLAGTPLVLEPVRVLDVLEPLLRSVQTIAQERYLSLAWEIPPQLPDVQANATALREVLNNLLENALKYTPTGGAVRIRLNRSAKPSEGKIPGLEISISNTGPGIPSQDLDHIFERRFRGVQAQGDIPGSGLGLAIARSLTEQMQGHVQVFSPAHESWGQFPRTAIDPGRGVTFTVWLPLAQMDPTPTV